MILPRPVEVIHNVVNALNEIFAEPLISRSIRIPVTILEQACLNTAKLASYFDLVKSGLFSCDGRDLVDNRPQYKPSLYPAVTGYHIHIDRFICDVGRCELEVIVHCVVPCEERHLTWRINSNISCPA